MDEIIQKNLDRMYGCEKGDMLGLLMKESFGGTAGSWGNVSCACANFFYDKVNGEIKYFENWQDVPDEIRNVFAKGSFTIAMGKNSQQIVECILSPNNSQAAQYTLEETIKQYNTENMEK